MTATLLFREAIAATGLTAPDEIVSDGRLHRFASNGNPTDLAGWYVLHTDALPTGSFGCWRAGLTQKWCAKATTALSAAERRMLSARLKAMRRQRDEDRHRQHAEAAARAQTLWRTAEPAPDDHPYLTKKQIGAHGLRVDHENRLIVPVRINNAITSLQFISPDGDKKFLPGGEVKGGSFVLGELNGATTILECEGFATGASLHEAIGFPVVVAFNAGNLSSVAEQLRQQYPTATILVCGDHDLYADEKPNTGLLEATKAAKSIGGLLVMADLDGEKADFNDVAQAKGLGAVQAAIEAALVPAPSVLDDVHKYLGRFVSYPSKHAHVAHVLWLGHCHLMDAWESTPRLAFLSPEPGSGKTRALELTETLVPRPIEAMNMSSASLFRVVAHQDGLPTVLFDEVDTIFGPRAKEHEEVRGVLNAGHRRGASAWRCVTKGKTIEPEEFPCFCAVALAGLGDLPDTILTRSVIVRMRRRAPGETVEPYRRREHAPDGYALRDRLAEWATLIRPTLNTNPSMPDGITDRAADVWESLLSIADAAGGDWPTRARVAAVTLVTLALGETPSLGVRLLADLKTIFAETDALSTVDLLVALHGIEEGPWPDLRGKALDARRLANLLKPYGIASKPIRLSTGVVRGYAKQDFHDAWVRYIPTEAEKKAPALEAPKEGADGPDVGASPQACVTSVTGVTPPGPGPEPGLGAGPVTVTGTSALSIEPVPSGTVTVPGYIYRPGSDPDSGVPQTVDAQAGTSPIASVTSETSATADDDVLVIFADPEPAPPPDTSAYPHFRHWVEAREAIRLKREAELPGPWTTDPILRTGKFCNVRRRDDRVSRWVQQHIIDPYREAPYLLEFLALGRLVNWPPTLQAILDAGHGPQGAPDWPEIGQLIEARAAIDPKVWTGAYVTPSTSKPSHPFFRQPKARYVCLGVLAPLFRSRDQLLSLCEKRCRQDVHAFLTGFEGLGGTGFLAGQIVDDWTWCPLLDRATDLLTWAPLGPGSRRGLNRLAGRPLNTKLFPATAVKEMIALRERLIVDLPWVETCTLMDIQNVCCETDKYLRVLHDQGTMKARYRPETGYPA